MARRLLKYRRLFTPTPEDVARIDDVVAQGVPYRGAAFVDGEGSLSLVAREANFRKYMIAKKESAGAIEYYVRDRTLVYADIVNNPQSSERWVEGEFKSMNARRRGLNNLTYFSEAAARALGCKFVEGETWIFYTHPDYMKTLGVRPKTLSDRVKHERYRLMTEKGRELDREEDNPVYVHRVRNPCKVDATANPVTPYSLFEEATRDGVCNRRYPDWGLVVVNPSGELTHIVDLNTSRSDEREVMKKSAGDVEYLALGDTMILHQIHSNWEGDDELPPYQSKECEAKGFEGMLDVIEAASKQKACNRIMADYERVISDNEKHLIRRGFTRKPIQIIPDVTKDFWVKKNIKHKQKSV